MKIKFLTEKEKRDGEDQECHSIVVDNKTIMRQAEWICPEDVQFNRDLCSPHDCKELIEMVIEAVKKGEEVEIVHEIVEVFVWFKRRIIRKESKEDEHYFK